MSDFVEVTAARPGQTLRMRIPASRWDEAFAALASELDDSFTWHASPVDDLALRSESAAEAQQ